MPTMTQNPEMAMTALENEIRRRWNANTEDSAQRRNSLHVEK